MRANARNDRGSLLTRLRSPVRADQQSPRFVRISQLLKLRAKEQVAAVCYRVREGEIEFLIVRTRGGQRWTFPKGNAEPGLTGAQAAAMEAFEEAGVHGRIEEASFARYVSCKRGCVRSSDTKSVEGRQAVTAHLCEVLRLAKPKESNRDRTWFSPEDAKQRLREGRDRDAGSEFARVLNRAVARIRRLHNTVRVGTNRQSEPRPAQQNDPLQKVQFEAAAEVRGRLGDSRFAHYVRRVGEVRQFSIPGAVARRREPLQAEVLPFSPDQTPGLKDKWVPGGKKIKALGTGVSGGSTG